MISNCCKMTDKLYEEALSALKKYNPTINSAIKNTFKPYH